MKIFEELIPPMVRIFLHADRRLTVFEVYFLFSFLSKCWQVLSVTIVMVKSANAEWMVFKKESAHEKKDCGICQRLE